MNPGRESEGRVLHSELRFGTPAHSRYRYRDARKTHLDIRRVLNVISGGTNKCDVIFLHTLTTTIIIDSEYREIEDETESHHLLQKRE